VNKSHKMEEVITFYRKNEKNGYLSNFAPYPISMGNKLYPTSEHYFQAMKFEDGSHHEEIRSMSSPADAAKAGRDRNRPLRKDWEEIKEKVMYDAIYAKFTQYPALRAKLLDTGEATLVEHTENDSYWGDGGDGTGKNRLGALLMLLRKNITK
jgi:ribA/ribD-fused uncharacterized protein